MIRSRTPLMVLAVFACALMVGTAQARIWHVPDDAPQVLSVESTSWTEVESLFAE